MLYHFSKVIIVHESFYSLYAGKQNAMHKAGHSKGEPSTSSGGKVKDVADLRSLLLFLGNTCCFWLLEIREKDNRLIRLKLVLFWNLFLVCSESQPGSSQLTIFFGGKVLVYNEFPVDKAKEIMEVAKQAKPVTEINIQTPINDENNNNKSSMVLPDLNEPTDNNHLTKEQQQQQEQNQIVERIARRASLHRFFAKRKDRYLTLSYFLKLVLMFQISNHSS